ncbi:MAG: SMC-Scp complex subunit ScpB [Chloroflexi bacterium]|nr:SMC-Scp complex subunit ScpB [Chloroflexota bacterium]
MDTVLLQGLVESLLFVSDGPVETAKLVRILEVSQEELDQALAALSADSSRRGVRLQRLGSSAQLVTSPEASPYVEKLLGTQAGSKLSTAALETLAIVAYRQPITRAGIEAIRGVNADRAINTLQNRGLIEESGRLEAAGRPILYSTTFEFLQHFGLRDLAELPALEELSQLEETG